MTSIKTNTTDCIIRKEELDFLRVAYLIIRVAVQAVKVKFDKEFHPGGLQTALNQAKSKLEDLKKKKKIINQKQWELLFPTSGNF